MSTYLDVGGGGGAEQSSDDFSNLPISSDPQSKELCPKQTHLAHLIREQPTNIATNQLTVRKLPYLIFIKVGYDNTNKKGEPNHTAQEHKDMDVDAMNLRQSNVLISTVQINQLSSIEVTVKKKVTYRSHSVYDDVSHLHPTLQ